ncbi:MAG: response regulator [Verrucomicrobiales bacterium]|nr:response regulator transcription factor [Verrucomicrobiota bacterium JB025]
MKILIVDDHAIVRSGMISLLREHFSNLEFGESANARKGFEMLSGSDWDLVIVDISMPGRSGLDLIQDIRDAKPEIPVLVVSAHPEKDYAVRALKLGASGYISKQSASEILVSAVKHVLSGGRYISPTLAEHLAGTLAAGGELADGHEALSNRELQVLTMIANGMTLKEIGAELALSAKTIATYRARIAVKMGMDSKVELTRYAMRHGLIH